MTETLAPDTLVSHPEHGQGRVIVDSGATVVVRFARSIEAVLRDALTLAPSLARALATGRLDDSRDTLLRAQALAIRSVNDQWGVFSRSRVQLLPHQLWVCHRVNRSWPFRWLVADDVGLGKTIEAGLVLMPLIASGRVRRLLILAPAKLVPQWQQRLRQMFDIRLQPYSRAIDTPQLDFWDTANMVVASIHTLRGEVSGEEGRPSKFLEAEPWDAVVVDEAHHLHADERTGETLMFQLLRAMEERRRIGSLLLFTGTPHRGKDYGFLSLLSLLRPGEFTPDDDIEPQLARLPEVMIRNNKATATDLRGNRLFTPVTVESREYAFSAEERAFYDTLSQFIVDGRAYASSLDGRAQTARMLVLITLQKLAASSIAAIRSALIRRRARLEQTADEARALAMSEEEGRTLDDRAADEEDRTPFAILAELMDGEIARLDELIALAEPIRQEHKIRRLVDLIEGELPPNEPVLLFTEYKATQALVVDALHERFGHGACAFINGDERLDELRRPDGSLGRRSWSREAAADAFNQGDVRFLVSTEAAGEGHRPSGALRDAGPCRHAVEPDAAAPARWPLVTLWSDPAGASVSAAQSGNRRGAHLGPAQCQAGTHPAGAEPGHGGAGRYRTARRRHDGRQLLRTPVRGRSDAAAWRFGRVVRPGDRDDRRRGPGRSGQDHARPGRSLRFRPGRPQSCRRWICPISNASSARC